MLLKIISLAFMALVTSTVSAGQCPTLPAMPEPAKDDPAYQAGWQGVAEPYSIRYTVKNHDEAPHGIGYLRVLNSDDNYYYWQRNMTIPLWSMPGELHFYGWIHNGLVYPAGGNTSYPLTGAGMVETGYEFNSFIVWEVTDNDWLRIRLLARTDKDVWVHKCHLDSGKIKFAFNSWETFLEEHGDWLHFRTQVPHILRAAPDINSEPISIIALDHKLVLQSIKGDWMKVKVEQPDWTCSGVSDEEQKKSIHDGWVKWRDDIKGPWVWVYTRGC